MEKIMGFKGFSKDLKCRDFQYEIGKTYATKKEDLKICQSGFHFCLNLDDVDTFYPFASFKSDNTKNNHRYCEVEILGDILHDDNKSKSCTDIIRIGRELDIKEINGIRNQKYWDAAYSLQQEMSNALIGGSMGLMIGGYMEVDCRVFHDIDITVPHYTVLPKSEDFKSPRNNRCGSLTSAVSSKTFYKNVDVDFFIDPNAKHRVVNFKGKDWNVADAATTLKAKIDYAFTNTDSSVKHLRDLCVIFEKIKTERFPVKVQSINGAPFDTLNLANAGDITINKT